MSTPLRRLALCLLPTLTLAACSLEGFAPLSLEGWNYVYVTFNPVDSSRISGIGSGQFNDGASTFEFGAQLAPAVVGQEYTVHVHVGSCTAIGNIVRTLPPVPGKAGGVGSGPSLSISATLSTGYREAGYVMDVHATVAGVERRVACGAFN
jgi:hypothetical protein